MACTARYTTEIRYARDRYNVQKHCAVKRRGIGWEITFEEWYKFWLDSGHWEERGRGGYVMARYGDKGPYAIGNVEIKHHVENMHDTKGMKRKPRTEEHMAKISKALTGRKRKVTQ
jgi:hypothetical protein